RHLLDLVEWSGSDEPRARTLYSNYILNLLPKIKKKIPQEILDRLKIILPGSRREVTLNQLEEICKKVSEENDQRVFVGPGF
ncbi:hypothetical protein HYX16_01640, partial [Candidatus Woesearchaeota archaeon]|nr:hypothetical protein [Candidatus Woesearchaeota archaeon]